MKPHKEVERELLMSLALTGVGADGGRYIQGVQATLEWVLERTGISPLKKIPTRKEDAHAQGKDS